MIPALEQAAAGESSSYPSLFSVVGCNSASSDGPRFSLTVFSASATAAECLLAVSARRLLLPCPPCAPLTGQSEAVVEHRVTARRFRFRPRPTQACA